MRIDRLEAFVVQQKLQTPFFFSQWRFEERSTCLVRVTAEDGTYGWGEGYGPASVVRAGVEFLAPLVVGQDALGLDAVWDCLHRRTLDYARSGVLCAAISAVDVALWDLKGKLTGQSVAALLGGVRRAAVRVYATGLYFTDGPGLPARLAAEAAGYADQGFTAIKMKVGLGLEADIQNIRAVREAIGPTIELMVDSNHAYVPAEAQRLIELMEPYRIGWFEEPVSPEDYAGYAQLRERSPIPIAGGECEYRCEGFRRLLAGQCVDIAQPDICAAGGLTETRRIAQLATQHAVPLTPHCFGTGVAFAAALHFAAAHVGPAGGPIPPLEMDRTENPLRDELVVPRFVPTAGLVPVPDAPGLGIDVDDNQLQQLRIG